MQFFQNTSKARLEHFKHLDQNLIEGSITFLFFGQNWNQEFCQGQELHNTYMHSIFCWNWIEINLGELVVQIDGNQYNLPSLGEVRDSPFPIELLESSNNLRQR